ncbi:MAG: sulfatase-like hydrolase/transferase [Verrucomicrobia bacterium]|nr:sulfatase-like hydrolase/transferase [Verrucomicrobiota bacterium]
MRRVNFHRFRIHCLTLLFTACAHSAGAANDATASSGNDSARPNFLFIYADDQRYDALSVVQQEQGARGRFPWFKTPHLDRLAAEGVRFRNAFVVNSLCAPSRSVFLTGRYNHFNGVASNFRPFPVTNVTHATLLRAAGYTTAYIGKWHMDSQRERPGFNHHYSFIGHARYFDPVFIVDGKDTSTKGWIDDLSTDYAIEFLRKQKGSGNPWLLVVGFKSPHGPFEPPPRATNRFAGELARAVPNLPSSAPYMTVKPRPARPGADSDEKVPVNLNYFRCISAVDDCVGRFLHSLEELGFARNTVVVYASDNGFYLGEHGLGDKRSAYDESLRIPFLVRYPALGVAARGRVVDEMVLNLDLAQTFLDFAGVRAPKEMQGRSWRPLLEGRAVGWRQSWFYEYFAERQMNSRVPDITAVRTTDAKLIRYPGHEDWTELFDLKADSYETKNLFRDPSQAELRVRLEAEHDRLAKVVGYRVPEYTDRPDWWGKPGGPDWKPDPAPALRLHFDFSMLDGNRVPDSSGLNNHGAADRVELGDGPDGRKALRLAGDGHIEVPKSPSLDPSRSAWTIEVVARAEKPDGVLVARGGRSQGYALWLKSGRPAFTVTTSGRPVTVEAKEAVTNWATFAGAITADRQIQLRVNNQVVVQTALPDFIGRDPSEAMQVGADLGSPVMEPSPPKFTGWIQSVRIFSGGK